MDGPVAGPMLTGRFGGGSGPIALRFGGGSGPIALRLFADASRALGGIDGPIARGVGPTVGPTRVEVDCTDSEKPSTSDGSVLGTS